GTIANANRQPTDDPSSRTKKSSRPPAAEGHPHQNQLEASDRDSTTKTTGQPEAVADGITKIQEDNSVVGRVGEDVPEKLVVVRDPTTGIEQVRKHDWPGETGVVSSPRQYFHVD
ncbi:unnamed protein product, partial [Amoebophrya sp. A25]